MLAKVSSLIIMLHCIADVQGSESDGFVMYPALRGSLKLHLEPKDWLSARILCHEEDSLLVSPWSEEYSDAIHKLQKVESLPVLYSGAKVIFPEGVYTKTDQALSLSPSDLTGLERCAVFLENGTTGAVDCGQQLPYACYKSVAVTPSCGPHTLGYDFINATGQCYKLHTQPRTWLEALRACQEEGAYLVIINSDAEAQAVVKLYGDRFITIYYQGGVNFSNIVAVGVYYWPSSGSWWTVHGQTMEQAGYTKWDSSEPKTTSHYVFMTAKGKLYTDNNIKQGFICEKKPILLGV